MSEYKIIGKRHNNVKDKVVTHVKIGTGIYEISKIISWIESKTHNFYTMYGNKRAEVYVKVHPVSMKNFLISTADGIPGNNIDNLPDC